MKFYLIAQDEFYPQKAMTDWHGPFDTLDDLVAYVDSNPHLTEDWKFIARSRDDIVEVVWVRDKPDWGDGLNVDMTLLNGVRTVKLSSLRFPTSP